MLSAAPLRSSFISLAAEGACAAMFLVSVLRPPDWRHAANAAWMENAVAIYETEPEQEQVVQEAHASAAQMPAAH